MKVVFNGVMEETRKGCKVCGGRSFRQRLATTKTYYLPSGRRMTFRIGRIEEVSDEDGEFLLSLNTKNKKVFDVWQV